MFFSILFIGLRGILFSQASEIPDLSIPVANGDIFYVNKQLNPKEEILSLDQQTLIKYLNIAIDYGQYPMIDYLLSNYDIDNQANKGVLIATKDQRVDIVRLLLSYGFTANLGDEDGISPLMISIYDDNKVLFELLMNADSDLNHQDKFGMTPLMVASYLGYPDYVEILLAKEADKSITDKDGKTALDYALMKEDQYMIDVLEGGS